MILPCVSRSMRSIGWITSARTWTTSPALMLDGTRSRTFPMSDMLAPAASDGDLHLALHLEQRAVALLHDRAHVACLAEPDVRAHECAARLWCKRHARDDGDTVLVGDDVDVFHVARGRHRRVDRDGDRDHRAILGDQPQLQLDAPGAVLHGLAREESPPGILDALVLAQRLGVRTPRRIG